jgi:hypothetical protein
VRNYRQAVLSSFDDFPIHQSSVPMAHTATPDANHYDRYFFNGYSPDGSLFFALAMGLYPNRSVADAAFSIVRDGVESSVFSSRRAPADRRDATTVGPIRVDVVEPLRTLRIAVDAPDQGLRAELLFEHRSPAVEEPHFFLRAGTRTFLDYTRLTQFGRWTGWVEVDGERIAVTPEETVGSRDRSWGIRPVGERVTTGAPATAAPQFFWLWAPVNFGSFATHFDVNDFSDGRRWHEFGCVAPDGSDAEVSQTVDWRVGWQPGTRWAQRFEYDLVGWDDSVSTVRLDPLYEFHMSGIGYGHPEWAHGTWRGESAIGGQRLSLPVDSPTRPDLIHIQAVCSATFIGADGTTDTGIGILEQLCIGAHPTGLTGTFDPYETPAS